MTINNYPPLPLPLPLGYKRHISEPVPKHFLNVDGVYDHERLSMRYEATIDAGHPFVGQLARYMREQGARLLSPALPKWWVLDGSDYELSLSIGTERACITLHDFDWSAPVAKTHSPMLSINGDQNA